jgi:hypothetical protein
VKRCSGKRNILYQDDKSEEDKIKRKQEQVKVIF